MSSYVGSCNTEPVDIVPLRRGRSAVLPVSVCFVIVVVMVIVLWRKMNI